MTESDASVISEEMVERAARALAATAATGCDWRHWTVYARAALEAVVPLVVAGERERAERIAKNRAADEYIVFEQDCCGNTAEYIAAAIRADTGGD